MTTAEAVEGLRDLFAAEEPLEAVAKRVAETAVAAVPHADFVSITCCRGPRRAPRRAPMSKALGLDHQQYASGRGPCLEAAMSDAATSGR